MQTDRLMLAISAGEWQGIQHRPHHFMRRSAKSGWTVIYLEPPATIISPVKNKQMLNRWKNWLKGVRQIEKNIFVLAPPPTLPFGNKYRLINKLNQRLIARTIKKAIKSFNNSEIDLYSFLPNAIDILPHIKFNKVIYDCVDDHTSFTGLITAETVYQMERELMERADVSFATAERLLEERKDWSNNFHLIPNGAEYEHFAKASDNSNHVPAEIKGITKPIIGFVGGISDWIDIPLITSVAKELQELEFILIGPILTDVSSLKELNNVKLLGSKEYKDLPDYIRHFDACLIPFKINKLTESVNPIKMFEYLSAGKPVISTPLIEVTKYKEYIKIASNKDETIKAIKECLKEEETTKQAIEARQKIGQANSWNARWQKATKLIDRQG